MKASQVSEYSEILKKWVPSVITTTGETIAAIATPPGEGAIAMIRISGSQAFPIAASLFRANVPIEKMQSRHLYFGRIVEREIAVDEGLCAIFRAPASYTGEDLVEISCHGGILISARILQMVLDAGIRLAHPGEFTQRAFLNGKMDLTQAEAVMDLIRAQSPLALRAARLQLEGAIGSEIEVIREELISILAHVEAFIDFPEEGIDPDTNAQLVERIVHVQKRLTTLLSTANHGRLLREGIRLAICGNPNVGKSSLLNWLVNFDRAIVSSHPGTTRDTLEERVNLNGISFCLIDTAGIRETDDVIESEGVKRALAAAEKADIILYIIDATQPPPASLPKGLPAEKLYKVWNKIDLLPSPPLSETDPAISCLNGAGIPELISQMIKWAGGMETCNSTSLATINARHQSCLKRSCIALDLAYKELPTGVELAAMELRIALDAVGEVIGVVDHEQILDSIFSTFCIGK